jgi:hypothetical protein
MGPAATKKSSITSGMRRRSRASADFPRRAPRFSSRFASPSSVDEVIAFCQEWADRRRSLDFDTDGVVWRLMGPGGILAVHWRGSDPDHEFYRLMEEAR